MCFTLILPYWLTGCRTPSLLPTCPSWSAPVSTCTVVMMISLFPCTESARPPSKRRKRKASSSNNSGAGSNNSRDVPPSGKQKRSPGPHGFNIGSSVPGVKTETITPMTLPSPTPFTCALLSAPCPLCLSACGLPCIMSVLFFYILYICFLCRTEFLSDTTALDITTSCIFSLSLSLFLTILLHVWGFHSIAALHPSPATTTYQSLPSPSPSLRPPPPLPHPTSWPCFLHLLPSSSPVLCSRPHHGALLGSGVPLCGSAKVLQRWQAVSAFLSLPTIAVCVPFLLILPACEIWGSVRHVQQHPRWAVAFFVVF